MRVPSFFLTLVLILPSAVLSANILFFFAGGNLSHKTSVWPWVLELAKRGHNVTFVSPHPKTPVAHPNITDHAAKQLQEEASKVYQVDRFKERDAGVAKSFNYNKIAGDACKAVVNSRDTDPVLGSLFREGSFDLVVVNSIFGECGYYVGHYFKAKMILYDSCTFITWFYDTFGVSPEAAWVPDIIMEFSNIPLTFVDRVYNNFMTFYWGYLRESLTPVLQEAAKPLLQTETENMPTLYDLENSVSLVLINSHPSVDFARTLPPLFIDVGGMGTSGQLKELPKNFKDFMDGAGSSGVVLISFGSTVLLNTVSTQYQAMFFHLIEELSNVKFILRWSGPLPKFLDKSPKNLLVSEWLPQKEILSHPKLKLFITHGGVSSIQEATYYGVPMIVMPLFADQDYNAYRIEAQEVGLKVEIQGLTEETLINAVEKVLKNDKFKKNMMQKRDIFRDRPLSPVDNAVFWTEFALRHEDTISTFRPMNQHLNAFQRRLIDVYTFYFAILFALAGILYKILTITWCLLFGSDKAKVDRNSSKKLN